MPKNNCNTPSPDYFSTKSGIIMRKHKSHPRNVL
jgi:hypothetical protein